MLPGFCILAASASDRYYTLVCNLNLGVSRMLKHAEHEEVRAILHDCTPNPKLVLLWSARFRQFPRLGLVQEALVHLEDVALSPGCGPRGARGGRSCRAFLTDLFLDSLQVLCRSGALAKLALLRLVRAGGRALVVHVGRRFLLLPSSPRQRKPEKEKAVHCRLLVQCTRGCPLSSSKGTIYSTPRPSRSWACDRGVNQYSCSVSSVLSCARNLVS